MNLRSKANNNEEDKGVIQTLFDLADNLGLSDKFLG
jgi:hypothetical protein